MIVRSAMTPLLATFAAITVGCSTLDRTLTAIDPFGRPSQIAVLVQPQLDGSTFGLRAIVMTQDDSGRTLPMREGTMRFFAYEDGQTVAPDHIWEFGVNDLRFASQKSPIGPSSTFWLPFEGQPDCASVTLIAKWNSGDGAPLVDRQQVALNPPIAHYEQLKSAVRMAEPSHHPIAKLETDRRESPSSTARRRRDNGDAVVDR